MIKIDPKKYQKKYSETVNFKVPTSELSTVLGNIELDALKEDFEGIMNSLISENIWDESYKYKKFLDQYIRLCLFLHDDLKSYSGSGIDLYYQVIDKIKDIPLVKNIYGVIDKNDYEKYVNDEVTFENFRKIINDKMKFINGAAKNDKTKTPSVLPFNNAEYLFVNGKPKKYSYSSMTKEIRTEYFETLGIEVCPYCNHGFIDVVTPDNKAINTFELDHFYPQSIFPLLAFSLYNFVPSCKSCNQTFKKDSIEVKDAINPIIESFGTEVTFIVSPDSSGKNYEVDFEFNNCSSEKKKKCETSDKIFALRARYSCHQNYIKDVIKKKRDYGDSFRNKIKESLRKLRLDDSEETINKMIYGLEFNEEEDKIYIMSKFTRDILDNYKEK